MENNNQFNETERAVLQWCSEHYKDSALSAQVQSASFKGRKWTGVGFYTDLDVSNALEKINLPFPIRGPLLQSPDIDLGGGSLLWGRDGYIDGIELYANGSFFRETITDLQLRSSDK